MEGPRQSATSTTDCSAAAAADQRLRPLPDRLLGQCAALARAVGSLSVGSLRRCVAHHCASSASPPISRRVRLGARAPSASRPIARSARSVALCHARFPLIAQQVARGTVPMPWAADRSAVHTSEPRHQLPGTRRELRSPAAPCVPRSPPGRSPSPVTCRISSAATGRPARGSSDVFPRVSWSTGCSTDGCQLSPTDRWLSTASSTDPSTATPVGAGPCPPSGRRPPPAAKRTGRTARHAAPNRSTWGERGISGG